MRMPLNLMMAIGKAALNLAGAGLVGDVAEIAKAAWDLWEENPEERIDELEAVVQAAMTRSSGAEQVVAEVAGDQPEPVRMKLATFLKHVPARIPPVAAPPGRPIRAVDPARFGP